jgi:hypothetical protein
LSDAVVYAVNTLQGAATAKGITLSSDAGSELPPVSADPTRIRQILIILIDNAIKFTPANGLVRVQARRLADDPHVLSLEVSDTGCGISPDMTEKIFERLFQASDPAPAGRDGLGLGLYICKELVTRQGGRISVDSTPGRGATFLVTLPVFSLANLIAPSLKRQRYEEGPITLVVTEVGSRTGWLSDESRAEQSQVVRELLQRCLHSDLDVLLPKWGFAGAVDLFFIVAMTDGIGGEAITKRIRARWDEAEHAERASLTLESFYRPLEAIKRDPSQSMESFSKNVATKIQDLMNEEISSRRVENEQ